jgi:hypothetical protein
MPKDCLKASKAAAKAAKEVEKAWQRFSKELLNCGVGNSETRQGVKTACYLAYDSLLQFSKTLGERHKEYRSECKRQ